MLSGLKLWRKSWSLYRASKKRTAPKRVRPLSGPALQMMVLEDRLLLAVVITATNVDSVLTDVDGDSAADPGDTLQYNVTITNSGSTDATGVSFLDTEDTNTTLVGGSVRITPIAFDDGPYALTGNTPITISAGAGVLANDIDPDSSTPLSNVGVTAVGLDTTGTLGTVVLNANGSFTFTPTTGFTGMTTFRYTARDADSLDSVVTGTVTMNVGGLIWYVDSSAASGGDGSFNAPFQTLAPLNGAGGAGDVDGIANTIFVYESGSTYTGGIELENTQLLIGESVGLGMVNGMTIGGSGSNPTIATGAAANDVTLASNNTVRGLTLGNSSGSALAGTSFGTLTIDTVTINTTGQALNLNTGAFAGGAAFTSITSTGGVNGISLTSVTGSVNLGGGALSGATGATFNVSGGTVSTTYSGNITQATASQPVVSIASGHSTGIITFQTGIISATSGTGLQFSNADGTYNFNGTTTLNGGDAAIDILSGSAGTFSFGANTAITSSTSTAFNANGSTANVTYSGNITKGNSGLLVDVTNQASGTITFQTGVLSATAGVGINLANADGTVNFNGITTLNGGDAGVDINNGAAGTFSFGTGTTITNPSGNPYVEDSSPANVTFNGTITKNNNAATAVVVTSKFGGATSFGGQITASTAGANAIHLANNAGGTISFTGGGLDIDTTTGIGFNATGGGTINVTGTNNSITSTAGAAINVANTTIGASNLNFRSITSTNAATDAISLSNTGTAGGLKVGAELPGAPTAGDGGTITNPGDNAISLVTTSNNFFRGLLVNGTGGHGVFGTGMSDGSGGAEATLEFRNSRFTSPGDADNESGLHFGTIAAPGNNAGSIVLTDVIVEQFEDQGFEAVNNTGSLTISITGTPSGLTNSTTKFDDNNDTHGTSGILVVSTGTASTTVNVTGVYFNNIEAEAIMLQSTAATSSLDVNLLNNISINGGGPDNFPSGGGFAIVQDASGSATFDIKGNNIRDLQGDAIVIIADGPSVGRIGGSNVADGNVISGSLVGDGIRIDTEQLLVSGPGPGNNFTATILIQNNQIGNDATFPGIGDDGIQILHRDGTKTLNLTIENNTIANTVSEAIRYFQDADVSDGALKPYGAVRLAGNTISSIGATDVFVFVTRDTADLDLHVSGNTFPAAGNRNIALDQSETSVHQITQVSVAALAAANTNSTASVSAGTITFNSPVTNPPLPSNPLLFAPGGVSNDVSGASDAPIAIDAPGASDVLAPSLPTPPAPPTEDLPAPAATSAPATVADDGVLSAAELDIIVQSAIGRWSATGLTADQLAALNAVTFEVTPMNGWYLGSAGGNHVQIDSDAGGFGWFIDATPQDDSEFPNAVTSTRMYTDPALAPAGHIDLLTTVMHELGHILGVDDSYATADRDCLMYGYATVGERRLPAVGQADGATPGSVGHEEYLIGPLNLGTLPAGKAVRVLFNVTINSLTNGLAPTISNQGTVSGSNFANVLTDDPAAGGAADPTTTTLDSLTLGNQVWIEANSNTVFNSGTDTPVNAAALTLFLSDGTTVVTTGNTNGSGVYQFTGLLPGDYIVRVNASNFGAGQALDGKSSITGSTDPDDNVDNDDNGVDNAAPATNGIRSLPITLAYNSEPTAGTGNDTNNTLDFGFTAGPPLTAVKVDSLATDVDGDGAADPGDTLQYTVTITNNTAGNLTGVSLSDTEDSNTTFVGGSLKITPIAFDDAYDATTGSTLTVSTAGTGILGNDVDPTVGSGAAILDVTVAPVRDAGASTAAAGTLTVTLANGTFTYTPNVGATAGQKEVFTYNIVDAETLNAIVTGVMTFNIISVPAPDAMNDSYSSIGNVGINVSAASGVLFNDTVNGSTITAFDATSANGGAVNVNANGSFTYNPVPGFEGSDTFTYTLTNGGGMDTATVTIVVNDVIWFIDNSAGGTNAGTLQNPFTSTASYNGSVLTQADDHIYLAETGTDYAAGLTLKNNQRLIGEGASGTLAGLSGITLPTHSNTLPALGAANNPEITLTNTNALTLASGNTVNGVDLTTTTGTGLSGTNFGTASVSDMSIHSVGGTAINLNNGSGTFTLTRVSANGGANNGIVLNDVNATSFTVTGTGSAGTGGTIQNKTGTDGSTTSGIGIFLNNTQNVSLNWMQLNDFDNFAIRGTSVTNFSLIDSVVNGTHGAGSIAANDEGAVSFSNLLGSSAITRSTVANTNSAGGAEVVLRVINTSGTLDRLTIDNSTISNSNAVPGTGDDAMLFEALNAAVMKLTVSNSHFTASRADLIQTNANNSSTMDIVVTGTEFRNTNTAILSGGGGTVFSGGGIGSTATVTFNISGNTFRDAKGHAINVFKGSGTTNFSGTISNNTVGVTGVANSGTLESAADISVESLGSGTMTVLISGNNLRQYNEEGIKLFANTGNSVLNATVIGNTVTEPGNIGAFSGLYAGVGGVAGDTATINLLLGSFGTPANQNSLVGSDPTNTNDVYLENQGALTTFNLSRGGSAAGTVTGVVQDDNVGNPAVGTAGTITLVAGNPPLPLLAAPGGVSSSTATADAESVSPDESGADAPSSFVSPTTHALSPAELNSIVQAAMQRWVATGLSDAQLAVLQSAEFEVSAMSGWYLGSASDNRILIDTDAGGLGWFLDHSPLDDSEFGNIETATRLYTTPSQAPAGHIDLLTTVMHEMGHLLGLEDSYQLRDSNSLMYGFATLGERRLPAAGQASGAVAGTIEHEEYLIGPTALGTLPAGKSVAVIFNVTINSLTNGLAPTISNQGTVSGTNFTSVLTDDPAAGGAADPTTTTLDALTLGGQIWIEAGTVNSVFNSGTDTVAGSVALTLFKSDGTTQVTTGNTNGSGVYQFTGLLPGDYIVRVDASNFGAAQTLDGEVSITGGADPDDNVDNDDNGVDDANPTTNGIRSLPITLAYNTEITAGTGNDTNNTLDFGFLSNPPPVIADLGGDAATFTERGSAVRLDDSSAPEVAATVTDDQTHFNGGSLTVSITANEVAAEDVLGISTAGTVSLSNGTNLASVVSVGGQAIGEITANGTGGNDLVVTFNTTNATPANVSTLIQALTYFNSNATDPSSSPRTVTVSVNDGLGSNDSETVTVNITTINDEPTLTATGLSPNYTENGSAADLFSTVTASAVEASQTFTSLTLTVTNVTDGASEILRVDGSDVALTNGNSVTTATNGLSVMVGVSANTATVSFTGATLSAAALQTLVDALSYRNASEDPTDANRVITITQLTDSGSNVNPNDNTTTLSIVSTVNVDPVNDEPTLTATGLNPTYSESASAADLFSTVSASTVESGQTFTSLTLTVTNVTDGASEILRIDGSDVALTNGNSVTTATNSLTVNVSLSGTTATVSFTGATLGAAGLQTLVDALSYRNTSEDPTDASRVVTITQLTDSGSNASPNDNTATLSLVSTVNVDPVNDEPTLTATGLSPTYTENASAADLFSTVTASAVEASQTFTSLTLTVTNVTDGASEILRVDGSDVALTNGNSVTTATNTLSVNVTLSASTATVSFTGATLSAAALQTLVDALSYRNASEDPTDANRVVTITQLTDSGSNVSPNDNTATLSLVSTVNVDPVNDEPTLTATGLNPTYTENGAAADLFSTVTASTIEAGQTFTSLTMTVTNVTNGASEILSFDGSDVALTNGNSVTTATNSLSVNVSLSGATATVSFTGATLSAAALQTLVDALSYRNTSENPTDANRVVTITQLTDSGSNVSPNDNTATLSLASTVNVDPVNDAPSGSDKAITIQEDALHTFAVADFGFSDTAEGHALLAVKITTLPGTGTLTNNDNPISANDVIPVADITGGLLKFRPVADGNGSPYTSFTFQVQDNGGNNGQDTDQSPNTVTFDVTAVADITNDTLNLNGAPSITANLITGTNGATADTFENPGAAITSVTDGMIGTVTFNANGEVTYTQNAPGNSDSFTYTVTSGGVTETATVNVTINSPPVITSAATASILENTAASVIVLDVNATDADVPLQTLTYALSGTDAAKFNIVSSNGRIRFVASPNAENPLDANRDNVYEFTVTVTDNGTPILSATQAVKITVRNVVETVGTTQASLAAGVLTITDTAAVTNDTLTLSKDAQGNIVISDPTNAISVAGGVNATNDFQARVPMSSVTRIVVNTGSGSDFLTVNFANGNPIGAGGLNYNGGLGPKDSLLLRHLGVPFSSVSYRPTTINDGSFALVPKAAPTTPILLTFSHLGCLFMDGTMAASLAFSLPAANDTVSLTDLAAVGKERFSGNNLLTLDFSVGGITGLTVNGNGGNDRLSVASLDAAFTGGIVLNGGAGNDTLTGSARSDILNGGGDNDVLNGNLGRDLLIGGLGADNLSGNEDDDILIGGNVTASAATLNTVRTLWTALVDYNIRKNNVAAQLIAGTNVFDDTAIDSLSGNVGRDLFFAKLANPNRDTLLDKAADEVLIGIL